MSSLKEWRHYILGHPLPIQVYTDHQNILYWTEPRNLNRRQARWMIELQEYDLEIHYQKGKLNTKADLLSRRADHDRGEKDNQEVILVKREWLRELTLEPLESGLLERIRAARDKLDKRVKRALEKNDPECEELEDGLIHFKGCIYVPKDDTLREDIIRGHHDSTLVGHPGQYKTQELIT